MPERPAVCLPAGFRFVDAHHHLWDLKRPGYQWLRRPGRMAAILGDYRAISRDFTVAMLERDGAPVTLVKSVHIETAEELDPVAETAWLQSVADANPRGLPNAIVGAADLRADAVADVLDRHMAFRNFRGVRMLTNNGDDFTGDPRATRGLAELATRGLSFDIDGDYPLFDAFVRLADRAPHVQFVLGHAGFPRARDQDYFLAWRTALVRLAERPNIACKISGLGMIDHRWNIETLRPWVLSCLDAFGIDRIMFATNWPVDSLFSTYAELVGAYANIISYLTADESDAVFAGNAERVYRC